MGHPIHTFVHGINWRMWRWSQHVVRQLASTQRGRRTLNSIYLRLTPAQRVEVHKNLAKIFRDVQVHAESGMWNVSFAGKALRIPISTEGIWLDWDTAVSIVGHDLEVKQTYEYLIGTSPPDVFVDIGANYGTHSLLFLAHGIRTLSFEPIRSCHEVFFRLCAANQVSPSLVPKALGNAHGELEICFPERDTWLGTTVREVSTELGTRSPLVRATVEVECLDDYQDQFADTASMLIKIDTEGAELAVLQGSVNVLERNRPTIIFESTRVSERNGLHDFLNDHGYDVTTLPWSGGRVVPLTRSAFADAEDTNFLALRRS